MERQSVDSISSIALNPAAVLCRVTDPGQRCIDLARNHDLESRFQDLSSIIEEDLK